MCKLNGCDNKEKCYSKYGGYCMKHRRNYLVYNNLILHNRFTKRESDYLKKDIQSTIIYIVNYDFFHSLPTQEQQGESLIPFFNGFKKSFLRMNKKNLFLRLKEYLYGIEKGISPSIRFLTKDFLKQIELIQGRWKHRKDIELRGIGSTDKTKCNNDMDFYTYDNVNDIDDRYFFSYQDSNSFIWFFDIRSFNKLIEMGQKNPYTTEEIPKNVIERSKRLCNSIILTKEDDIIDKSHIILTKEQIIKQKVTDIFSQIEQYGFACNIEWFNRLNINQSKKLYSSLEDIWNYRLDISNHIKSSISPPNGLVFNTSINYVSSLTNIEEVKEIILNDVMKFNNAINGEYKKLGYMYFLIGLGTISKECYESHQWLMYAL